MSSKREPRKVEKQRRRRSTIVKRQNAARLRARGDEPGSGVKDTPPAEDTRARRMPLQNPHFEVEVEAWNQVGARDEALRETAARHARALELVAEGWRADSDVVAEQKAHEATKVNELCADAWLLEARRAATRPEQRLQVHEVALRCAEAVLGPDLEKRYRGQFWRLAESRPFVRAKSALGLFLWEVGFRKQALRHIDEILKLVPTDPLGMRFHLLGWHLAEGRHRQARGLLRRYTGRAASVFLWGAVLERLQAGDEKGAHHHCERALGRGAHAAELIANPAPLPSRLPSWLVPGSSEDALLCAQILRPAWRSTPGALAWLRAAITPEAETELRQTA